MLDSVQGYVVRCPYRAGVCLPQDKSEVLAMKKQAAAILLAMTLLAGCARSPAQSSPDLFDLSEPEEQSTALRMVAGAAKGTQGAYILHNSPDGNFRSILFVDAATHIAEPVCSREGCAHNDESCSAWLPGYPQSQFLFTLGGGCISARSGRKAVYGRQVKTAKNGGCFFSCRKIRRCWTRKWLRMTSICISR